MGHKMYSLSEVCSCLADVSVTAMQVSVSRMNMESFLAVASTIPLGMTVKSASLFTMIGLGEEQQQRVPMNVCVSVC